MPTSHAEQDVCLWHPGLLISQPAGCGCETTTAMLFVNTNALWRQRPIFPETAHRKLPPLPGLRQSSSSSACGCLQRPGRSSRRPGDLYRFSPNGNAPVSTKAPPGRPRVGDAAPAHPPPSAVAAQAAGGSSSPIERRRCRRPGLPRSAPCSAKSPSGSEPQGSRWPASGLRHLGLRLGAQRVQLLLGRVVGSRLRGRKGYVARGM